MNPNFYSIEHYEAQQLAAASSHSVEIYFAALLWCIALVLMGILYAWAGKDERERRQHDADLKREVERYVK